MPKEAVVWLSGLYDDGLLRLSLWVDYVGHAKAILKSCQQRLNHRCDDPMH